MRAPQALRGLRQRRFGDDERGAVIVLPGHQAGARAGVTDRREVAHVAAPAGLEGCVRQGQHGP
jgi:hypothetical protein